MPEFVRREFEDYLKCGRLEQGFLRIRCEDCHQEQLVAFSCKHRGFCPSCGARRMVESAALLVDEVLPRQPMRQWVLSVPFQLRFLFAKEPQVMGRVLRIVYRAIETYLIHQAGQTRKTAKTGAVTLIQRFGSALNLNIHFPSLGPLTAYPYATPHILFLDGVYIMNQGSPVFHRNKPPTKETLTPLIETISERIGSYLERAGLLVRDMENSTLNLADTEDPLIDDLVGHSVCYRIAIGPQAGRKAFTLQTLPGTDAEAGCSDKLAKASGFSLHAGVAVKADQRRKLERICRYIARPAISVERLSLTAQGQVRYTLKTPYTDGTTHVVLDPLDFIARLAALVPKPRVNLTRYHGVFAPNSALRHQVTPAKRGRQDNSDEEKPLPDRHGHGV